MKFITTLLLCLLLFIIISCDILSNNDSNSEDSEFRIIYSSNPSGSSDIYLTNSKGSYHTNLTNSPTTSDRSPCVSPDGSTIIYAHKNSDNNTQDILSMTIDDQQVANLTTNDDQEALPSYSPDGKLIVYYAWIADGSSHIFTINSDGSGKKQLTSNDESRYNVQPMFSPDGSKILYVSPPGLKMMDIDGSNKIEIGEYLQNIQIHPSDLMIIGNTSKTDYNTDIRSGDIYLMDVLTAQKSNLTNNSNSFDHYAVFSPDAQIIVFASNSGTYKSHDDIYSLNLSNNSSRRLTNNPLVDDSKPRFSPDGKRIVYVNEDNKGYSDIYIMNLNDNGKINLTNTSNVSESYPICFK